VGHAGVAALLLDRGAGMEIRDRETGATPLFQAAAWGRKTVVDLLVKRGADVNAKNLLGVSPLAAAGKNGYVDIARVLRERGGQ
jgi:ankyrin repeat protein